MYQWQYDKDGRFKLIQDDITVIYATAKASDVKGRKIDSRFAELKQEVAENGDLTLVFEAKNGLRLVEELTVVDDIPYAKCVLSDVTGAEVETSNLIPLVADGNFPEAMPVWRSLFTKMLQVPFDNTMWLRFESVPLRAGRISFDLTVVLSEETREGVLLGAADFNVWKNAAVCSATDARTIEMRCGVANEGSHDSVAHGTIVGKEVESSRFIILYGADYRQLMVQYGETLKKEHPPIQWPEGVPFGFNSWAGLAWKLDAHHYKMTGEFLRDELQPASYQNDGFNYNNLDACWSAMDEKEMLAIKDECHAKGQRTGIYDAPFAFFGKEADRQKEIPGVPGHVFDEILLRDEYGEVLPRVDGAHPFDLSHPLWKEYTKKKFDRFIEWGYDYIKVDFMTHGCMEGVHYDPAVRTGRQCIDIGYRYVDELLAPERVGRPFFISLSIAPLFPAGFGHARRFSCDAFGTYEDIEYILNAQTYGWWENRNLYDFNDPDHIVLLKSFGMEKDSTLGEARARYTAAAIAGTVMMLSDDYDRPEAVERAKMFATNAEVNRVAASHIAFMPVEANGPSASHAFTATVDDTQYVALFTWDMAGETQELCCKRAGIPAGKYRDLWSGKIFDASSGVITWTTEGCDAILLKAE